MYRRTFPMFMALFMLCVCMQVMVNRQPGRKSTKAQTQQKTGSHKTDFHKAVQYHADKNDVIYLALVDSAYVSMALNLYETSFKGLDIQNYLFVCSDSSAHWSLHKHGINSINYFHHNNAQKPSDYDTKAFKRKTHLKTKMILDALILGFTVIVVDVDIVFLKDPMPHFDTTSDIQIQDNVVDLNSGFYMARPTPASIKLHQTAWTRAASVGSVTSNQNILSPMMIRWSRTKKLSLRKLPGDFFPCGKVYFEQRRRMFFSDNPPKSEVLVHNNWLVTKAAKIYRFKENLLWDVDTDGYFSDPTRKYLTYDNAVYKDLFLEDEIEALQTALLIGHLLNRTVILPTFSCQRCNYPVCKVTSLQCAFNTHFKIATFDSFYEGAYREHAFLDHSLVPDSVKVESTTYLILTSAEKAPKVIPSHVKQLTTTDKQGPTEDEIRAWFSDASEPVLRFFSLNKIYGNFRDKSYIKPMAFNRFTDYRQKNLRTH